MRRKSVSRWYLPGRLNRSRRIAIIDSNYRHRYKQYPFSTAVDKVDSTQRIS